MPIADLLGGFGAGFGAGTEIMGGLQDARRQGKLAALLQQGVSARDQRPELLGQIARLGGQDALTGAQTSFGKMDDAARDDLAASAGQFAAIAEADENAAAQMYPSLAAKARAIGIPVPETYDKRFLPAIQKLAVAGQGTGTNAELQTFQAMTQGLSPEDVQKARRIQLGLDGRASSAAIAYKVLKGADGRERLVAADPREPGAIVIDGQSGFGMGGGQPAPMQQVQYATSDGQPIPPEDAAAFQAAIAADARGEQFDIPVGGRLPPRMDYQNGGYAGAFVSPSEAESAYNTEAAKQAAQLAALPTQEAIKTQAAIATEQGKTGVQTQADIAKDQRQKSQALSQFETAMRALDSGLSNSVTGPLAGRLPALTANQQIAEGGVAAMAPILKQLFRTAGEGTFTDKDQELLMRMLPTRQDLPEARKAKIANISAIVRAKLGQQAAPAAPRVLKFNPATGKIE